MTCFIRFTLFVIFSRSETSVTAALFTLSHMTRGFIVIPCNNVKQECNNVRGGGKFMSFNRDRVEDRVLCILAVPRTTLFWRETSDVVPGICLGVTAPNAFIGDFYWYFFTFMSEGAQRPVQGSGPKGRHKNKQQ